MTTPSIDDAFIMQFGADVKVAYQRTGSKVRGTVRARNFGPAEKTRFQRYGKRGMPTTKARHAEITPQNALHDHIDLTMVDYYDGEYIDALDLLKTNIDERQLCAQAQSYAHGRKTDDILFTAMGAAALTKGTPGGGLLKYASSVAQTLNTALALALMEQFNSDDVPDDGRRFWQTSPDMWTKLMGLQEFTRMEYIPQSELPFQGGMVAKRWLNFAWMPHSGLPKNGSSKTRSFVYHSSAVGHGILQELKPDITWQGTRQAWFIATSMSQAAVTIDNIGGYEVVIA
ncbi:phage capsid protein [Azospirillum sp. sgz301742]